MNDWFRKPLNRWKLQVAVAVVATIAMLTNHSSKEIAFAIFIGITLANVTFIHIDKESK